MSEQSGVVPFGHGLWLCSDESWRAHWPVQRQVSKSVIQRAVRLVGKPFRRTRRLADQRMKLVVVIGRVVGSEHTGQPITPRILMGMAVVMVVVVAVSSHLRCGQGGRRMGRGTMRQDDDQGSDQQCKDGCQHDHAVCRMNSPTMMGLRDQALECLVLSYPPWGDSGCV